MTTPRKPEPARSLGTLGEQVSRLGVTERELVSRLFHIERRSGELVVPPSLTRQIERWFDGVAVSPQSIVRVENHVTGESVLINPLRALRPHAARAEELEHRIERARVDCDFCDPESRTTADVWGRVRGRYGITAANVAKYDAEHGLVVFREHHPHRFAMAEIEDYLATARAWIERARAGDTGLRFPLVVWNCLDAAGASQVHGHLHVVLARDRPYARDAHLLAAAARYRSTTGRNSYWEDWIAAHRALGLVADHGAATAVATLTPTKDREIVVVGGRVWDRDLALAFTRALRTLVDGMDVESFNAALRLPELDGAVDPDDRVIARVVDRGGWVRGGGGIGAMELYGTPVVSSDPYETMAAWRAHAAL